MAACRQIFRCLPQVPPSNPQPRPRLKQVGSSNWVATGLSGEAKYGLPGEGAFGTLLSGSIERSNVDITEELVGLITAQRYFQANAKAIDTATQISQTVLNLRT